MDFQLVNALICGISGLYLVFMGSLAEPDNSNSGGTEIGFIGLLFIVFLVLKLTKVITWSWWWVTAPLWMLAIPTVVLLVIMLGIFLYFRRRTKR